MKTFTASLGKLMLSAICASGLLVSSPGTSEAQSYRPALTQGHVYFLTISNRSASLGLQSGKFCKVAGSGALNCASGEINFSESAGLFTYTQGRTGGGHVITLSEARYTGSGKFAMLYGSYQGRTIVPNGATFYLNAKPGTIYVVPMRGMSAEQSVALAKQVLGSKSIASDVAGMRFEAIRAARATCTGQRKSVACKLGGDLNPANLWTSRR